MAKCKRLENDSGIVCNLHKGKARIDDNPGQVVLAVSGIRSFVDSQIRSFVDSLY